LTITREARRPIRQRRTRFGLHERSGANQAGCPHGACVPAASPPWFHGIARGGIEPGREQFELTQGQELGGGHRGDGTGRGHGRSCSRREGPHPGLRPVAA
jgi:hypothetical protein